MAESETLHCVESDIAVDLILSMFVCVWSEPYFFAYFPYSAHRPFPAPLKCETENCFYWFSFHQDCLEIGAINSIRYKENCRLVRIIKNEYLIIFSVRFGTREQ